MKPVELIAVADLHGDWNKTLETFTLAGLIDAVGAWAAGSKHFVQTGDVVDRGPDSVKILTYLHGLQVRGCFVAAGQLHTPWRCSLGHRRRPL